MRSETRWSLERGAPTWQAATSRRERSKQRVEKQRNDAATTRREGRAKGREARAEAGNGTLERRGKEKTTPGRRGGEGGDVGKVPRSYEQMSCRFSKKGKRDRGKSAR